MPEGAPGTHSSALHPQAAQSGSAAETFYITAAIDYVNAAPHLGTTYEKIGCDVIARYNRLAGKEVRFTMGSDEHSQSVERSARARGMDPEAFCDEQAQLFQSVWAAMDISPTAYVRTGGPENSKTVNQLLARIHERGHIYKGWYQAWFCPSCEQFYTDKELADKSQCPVHGKPLEWIEEENYFFRLSSFQEPLLAHFADNPEFLTPEPRRNEILNFINAGLADISISRGFSSWGLPLPFDPGQVVYTWIDALPSYLTGAGFSNGDGSFERFWPADVHVIGKDITRFHAVIWPALLMAAGIPLPRQVHSHGHITLGGERMSKTRGIFIDPMQLVGQFGSDAVRYVLMAEVPFDRDGDFSIELFIDRYNADLANDYGNLVSRTQKMVARYFGGRVPALGPTTDLDREVAELSREAFVSYCSAMERLDTSGAIAAAQRLVGRANRYVEEAAPWKLAAAQDPRLGSVCYTLLEAIRISSILLVPFIPEAAGTVLAQLGAAGSQSGTTLEQAEKWGLLTAGAEIQVGEILFPRLDRAHVLEQNVPAKK